MRHSATWSLVTRRDVVVVASVSCIYGLGTPQEYIDRMIQLRVGDVIERDQLLRRLVEIQYTRNDLSFTRGTFRVRGDTIEIIPVYEELAVRIEMFGDEIERLMTLSPVTGEVISEDDDALRLSRRRTTSPARSAWSARSAASSWSSSTDWRSWSARASCSRRSG